MGTADAHPVGRWVLHSGQVVDRIRIALREEQKRKNNSKPKHRYHEVRVLQEKITLGVQVRLW